MQEKTEKPKKDSSKEIPVKKKDCSSVNTKVVEGQKEDLSGDFHDKNPLNVVEPEKVKVSEEPILDADHVFDEMPISVSRQEYKLMGQLSKLKGDLVVSKQGIEHVEMELQPKGSKSDAPTLFDEMPEPVQLFSSIEKHESNALKLIDEMPKREATHCIEFIHNSKADGGKVVRISDIESFVDLVGAVNNLVFDPGGRNRKRPPKEMMEAEFDEFMLTDRTMEEPRGDIFLQLIISKFSSYNACDHIRFKFDEMLRFAIGIIQKHEVEERLSFGIKSESTFIFDPGITEGLHDHPLKALCSFLELLVINNWLLQQLLAFDVYFLLVPRMIWVIAWEFENYRCCKMAVTFSCYG